MYIKQLMHSHPTMNKLIDVAQYFYQITHYLPTDYLSVMANVSVQTDKLMFSAAFVFLGQWVDIFKFQFIGTSQSFGELCVNLIIHTCQL